MTTANEIYNELITKVKGRAKETVFMGGKTVDLQGVLHDAPGKSLRIYTNPKTRSQIWWDERHRIVRLVHLL